MMRSIIVAALLLGGTAKAAEPDARTRALAAGYKAAFLCSGTFNAGQAEARIAADDLSGIYPDYQALVASLPATIDRTAKTVSVAFDPSLPPRVAAWRPLLGCAQLPIGAPASVVAQLPRLHLPPPDLAGADARAWPLGDARAAVRVRRAGALDAIVASAFDGQRYGARTATTAVLVLVDGRIAAERYRDGWTMHTPQRTWSAAKSLTATLIGRAVMLGKADVSAPAMIPEWRAPGDPRAAITLEQLLRMNSGLWTDGPGSRTDAVYLGGATVAETAATAPLEAAPGSRFNYANNDTLLAAYSLKGTLGADALAFPFTELLWPLGMMRTTPETDWRGNYILSSQVWTTARDLARLAMLYQNDGMVGDRRLLKAGWAEFVATAAGAQPNDALGYGAQFWLHGAKQGLPEGSYAMAGNRGQHVMIVPAAGVIVVRRGFDASGVGFDIAALTRDVLAALSRNDGDGRPERR